MLVVVVDDLGYLAVPHNSLLQCAHHGLAAKLLKEVRWLHVGLTILGIWREGGKRVLLFCPGQTHLESCLQFLASQFQVVTDFILFSRRFTGTLWPRFSSSQTSIETTGKVSLLVKEFSSCSSSLQRGPVILGVVYIKMLSNTQTSS